jgi:hypothetical protein
MRVALSLACGIVLAAACSATGSAPPGTGGSDGGSPSTTTSTSPTISTGGSGGVGGCVADLAQSTFGLSGDVGCEFWALDPPFYKNGAGTTFDGPCYALFVVNTWDRPANVTVERDGQSFDLSAFGRIPHGVAPNLTYDPVPPTGIPQDEVAILFLSHDPGSHHDMLANGSLACPVPPAVAQDAAISGSGRGSAFHLVSDTPITVYDIVPFGGATTYFPGASLLHPTTAWGHAYIALAPPASAKGKAWMAIVAGSEGATVEVSPATLLPGGPTLADAPAGMATQISLAPGEAAQWVGADPTKTIVHADAPIALLTGATALTAPLAESPGGSGTDSAHLQLTPVHALASEHVGAGVVSRLANDAPETVTYTLMGVVDGTTLTYDPPALGKATLDRGEVATIATTQIFSVRSQDDAHPFVFTQTMSGAPESSDSKHDCSAASSTMSGCYLGDEEWLAPLSPRQFLNHYLFFVDPSYATTNLVITRMKGPAGFSPVAIDCLGGDVTGWRTVGSEGKYEVAHVDLVRREAPVASCGGSRVQASSEGLFGVTVWGTDLWASYAYPAGGDVAKINGVDLPR